MERLRAIPASVRRLGVFIVLTLGQACGGLTHPIPPVVMEASRSSLAVGESADLSVDGGKGAYSYTVEEGAGHVEDGVFWPTRAGRTVLAVRDAIGKLSRVVFDVLIGITQGTTTFVPKPSAQIMALEMEIRTRTGLPGMGFQAVTLADGRTIVTGGSRGSTNSDDAYDAAFIFEPEEMEGEGAWRRLPSMGEARYAHQIAQLPDGRVLVTGGRPSLDSAAPYLSSTEIFDPAADGGKGAWSDGPDMNYARDGHRMVVSGDALYVVGGRTAGDTTIPYVERFDAAANGGQGAWTNVFAMASPRRTHMVARLDDGRILVTGGHDGVARVSYSEIYDPSSGAWNPISGQPLSGAREGSAIHRLADGRFIVMGGYDVSGETASVEIFDPATESWTPAASLMTAVRNFASFVASNGKVFVVGGIYIPPEGWASSPYVQVYDPQSDTWVQALRTEAERHYHLAVPLPDGRVLIAGGNTRSYREGVLRNFVRDDADFVLDPASGPHGTWAFGPFVNAASPRYDYLSTQLKDGRVMFVGGLHDDLSFSSGSWRVGSYYINETGIYDPATRSWRYGAEPSIYDRPNGCLLTHSSGRVILAGGYTSTRSVEIFDPEASDGAGAWSAAPELPTAQTSVRCAELDDGRVLVIGNASSWVLDAAFSAWSAVPFPVDAGAGYGNYARQSQLVRLRDGRLLQGGTSTSRPRVFDPETTQWSAVAQLSIPRHFAAMTLMRDGRVLAVGGSNGSSNEMTSEIYDPASDSWSAGASTSVATQSQYAHSFVTFPDGRMLLIFDRDVFVFDPSGLSVTRHAGVLEGTDVGGGRVLLPLNDGRAMLFGGARNQYTYGTMLMFSSYDPVQISISGGTPPYRLEALAGEATPVATGSATSLGILPRSSGSLTVRVVDALGNVSRYFDFGILAP